MHSAHCIWAVARRSHRCTVRVVRRSQYPTCDPEETTCRDTPEAAVLDPGSSRQHPARRAHAADSIRLTFTVGCSRISAQR